jgi:hypothetical protein
MKCLNISSNGAVHSLRLPIRLWVSSCTETALHTQRCSQLFPKTDENLGFLSETMCKGNPCWRNPFAKKTVEQSALQIAFQHMGHNVPSWLVYPQKTAMLSN